MNSKNNLKLKLEILEKFANYFDKNEKIIWPQLKNCQEFYFMSHSSDNRKLENIYAEGRMVALSMQEMLKKHVYEPTITAYVNELENSFVFNFDFNNKLGLTH